VEAVELKASRREVLTALVGAAVAQAACRAEPPRLECDGQLLGQSAALGHRLRDGFRPEAPGAPERREVVVVGAGMSGLCAAWRLQRAGLEDFAVLELEPAPGGTAASGQGRVAPHPWGAHYVPVPSLDNRALVSLLRELGVVEGVDAEGRLQVGEQFLCRAPQERLFFGGQWSEGLYPRLGAGREELAQLRRFEAEVARWVGLRDAAGRRAFALPSARSGRGEALDALDGLSMGAWLRSLGLTSPRLRWYVDYACRDDYGLGLEATSAWAGLFYFASRVANPGERGAEFITWPEGNGRLVRHLAQVAGPRLRSGVAVTEVRPTADGVEVRTWDERQQAAGAILARHVICALPVQVAARVVAPLREQAPAHLKAFTSSPWLVAHLSLRGRPRERDFPPAWDNVLHGSASLGYVSATHQQLNDHGPTEWTYYRPFSEGEPGPARKTLLEASWRQWVDAVVADLSRAHPDLPGLVERVDVWRWGHAMVRPVVGLMRGGALEAARRPLGRIHFAHTDLSGMALLEEAQHWGVAAAEAVLKDRGWRFDSAL
jgi:phytoene dehydrogenase-like protein